MFNLTVKDGRKILVLLVGAEWSEVMTYLNKAAAVLQKANDPKVEICASAKDFPNE